MINMPPSYVVVPSDVINQAYKPDKPPRALFASYVRLLSLAWENKFEQTPVLREDELYETKDKDGRIIRPGFLKLSRRQYFEQKADMERLIWLRSNHPRPGFVQFTFSRSITMSDPSLGTDEGSNGASAEKRTISAENRTLKVGGGESLNLNQDSSPPPKEETSAENRTGEDAASENDPISAENRTNYPSVEEILSHTDLLFDGSLVMSKGLETREPVWALCWCAYAYKQKARLTGPGGVVRNRLMENKAPPEWTKHKWQEVLPENFLEALGLIQYECELCHQMFGKWAELETHEATHPLPFVCPTCLEKFVNKDDLNQHMDAEHPEPDFARIDASVYERIDGRMSPAQVWETVLGQLQLEMPRASFDTWVRDTQAVRFDGNVLSIGVRNAYAQDWLESRLTSTVNRLLVGILDAGIKVQFVVNQLQEVGNG